MTRLTTYTDLIELANTDMMIQVRDADPGEVDIIVQYEADTNSLLESEVVFTKEEFKAFVGLLYAKYVLGTGLESAVRNFDA